MIQIRDGLLWPVGGPSSGPLGATVPSVEAFLFVFLTSRRLDARNASTDGTVAPRGLGRSPVVCWRSSLGPLGATVPLVEAFLFVFLKSRRLDARNASTDGAVALRGRVTSRCTQRDAQRQPPPFRCAERGCNGNPPLPLRRKGALRHPF